MAIPQFYQGIITRWKKANPLSAHQLGFHEYDGQIPDYSEDYMNTRISEIKNDIQNLTTSLDNFQFEGVRLIKIFNKFINDGLL